MNLSFKQVLHILDEGTQEEVVGLQKQITDLDVAIQQRTKPLIDRKMRLQSMLAQKQKMLDDEMKNTPPPTAAAQPNGQQPVMAGNRTTTPGATSAQTPGVGGPAMG